MFPQLIVLTNRRHHVIDMQKKITTIWMFSYNALIFFFSSAKSKGHIYNIFSFFFHQRRQQSALSVPVWGMEPRSRHWGLAPGATTEDRFVESSKPKSICGIWANISLDKKILWCACLHLPTMLARAPDVFELFCFRLASCSS